MPDFFLTGFFFSQTGSHEGQRMSNIMEGRQLNFPLAVLTTVVINRNYSLLDWKVATSWMKCGSCLTVYINKTWSSNKQQAMMSWYTSLTRQTMAQRAGSEAFFSVHLPVERPWAGCLISPLLGLLICKMGIITFTWSTETLSKLTQKKSSEMPG